MGNILAVSQGDNKVSLWKESGQSSPRCWTEYGLAHSASFASFAVDGDWKNLSSLKEGAETKAESKGERKSEL
jgi:hypothetical protein